MVARDWVGWEEMAVVEMARVESEVVKAMEVTKVVAAEKVAVPVEMAVEKVAVTAEEAAMSAGAREVAVETWPKRYHKTRRGRTWE